MAHQVSVADLEAKIAQLELKLIEAAYKASEADRVAKEIALAADDHVNELEKKLSFQLSEDEYKALLSASERRISVLEDELKELRSINRSLRADNLLVASSAKEHVDELVGQLAAMTKENQRLMNDKIGLVSQLSLYSSSMEFDPVSGNSESEKSNLIGNSKRKSVLTASRRGSTGGGYLSADGGIILKSGYLSKKSPSMLIGWQSRYFVFRGDLVMAYYQKEQEHRSKEEPKGSINLSLIPKDKIKSCVTINNEMLKIDAEGRIYDLRCSSKDVAKEWYESITAALAEH